MRHEGCLNNVEECDSYMKETQKYSPACEIPVPIVMYCRCHQVTSDALPN